MSTPADSRAIRPLYEEHGATEYYRTHGATYRNPHEPVVRALIEQAAREFPFDKTASVLDLAAGSGEATLALREIGCTSIDALDPFTGAAYFERTGQCCEAVSFEEIARGVLSSHRYELCVCSFALHLAPNSILPNLCFQLALICKSLWILTPHRRPHIKEDWGWKLRGEILLSRVRLRVYDSRLTNV